MRAPLALFASLMLGAPIAASALMDEVSCDDRARLTSTLTGTLGAERQGSGLRDPDTMLEVWVTPANGDWIIVQHYASGTSCIVAIGAYWETAPPNPA